MRLLIAMAVVSALSVSPTWADPALNELLACRRMADSAARLECFDRASDAASTVGQRGTPPEPSKPATVESSIVRISPPATGRVDFALDNGQVWRQMDADSAKTARVGDRVVVSKAFLGAYWLRIEGGRAWRVTLVQ